MKEVFFSFNISSKKTDIKPVIVKVTGDDYDSIQKVIQTSINNTIKNFIKTNKKIQKEINNG